jgi:ubiquitin C-terminal hydrolase
MNWNATPIIGLPNTGAICYFNSMLQALMGCPSFLRYVRHERHQELMDVIYERCAGANLVLLNEVNKKNNNIFYGQQCCNEFFIKFVEYLSESMQKDKIHHLFGIEYETKVYCKKCNILKKINNDILYSIHVSETFQGNIEDVIINGYSKLEDYVCDHQHKKHSYKISVLKQLPYILVITFNKYTKKRNMIYPPFMEIKTVDRTYKYKLMSVIDHFGTQQSGHYTCRSIRNQKIFLFDDTRIIPESHLTPLESSYMIFYHIV